MWDARGIWVFLYKPFSQKQSQKRNMADKSWLWRLESDHYNPAYRCWRPFAPQNLVVQNPSLRVSVPRRLAARNRRFAVAICPLPPSRPPASSVPQTKNPSRLHGPRRMWSMTEEHMEEASTTVPVATPFHLLFDKPIPCCRARWTYAPRPPSANHLLCQHELRPKK